jgi:hypothetical protein
MIYNVHLIHYHYKVAVLQLYNSIFFKKKKIINIKHIKSNK